MAGSAQDPIEAFLKKRLAESMASSWGSQAREFTRAQAHAVTTQHLAETGRMVRMAAAKAVGIDPVHFDVPFPGTNSSTVINVTTPPADPAPQPAQQPAAPSQPPAPPSGNGALGSLGKLVLGGAMATGLGGLGLGAYSALKPAPQAPAPITQMITTPAQEVVPWVSLDGGKTWKEQPIEGAQK